MRCGEVKTYDEPLLIEWPAAERGKLEAQVQRGKTAVVRYEGCTMRVLSRCEAAGVYQYRGVTRKREREIIRDENELFAKLPFGAAQLEGTLKHAQALTVSTTIVGRYDASGETVAPEDLKGADGACEGATHVVAALSVGAFRFMAGASSEVGAGATVAGIGAGAGDKGERSLLREGGAEPACEASKAGDARPPDGCGEPLRVEVVPIGKPRPAAAVCPQDAEWDGHNCVRRRVITQVQCPAGTTLREGRCEPEVNRECPPGTTFQSQRGCVALSPSPRDAPPQPAAPSDQATGGALIAGRIVLGVSALAAVTWAVTGVLEMKARSEVDSNCNSDKHCNQAGAAAAARGRTMAWAADISLGVALVAVLSVPIITGGKKGVFPTTALGVGAPSGGGGGLWLKGGFLGAGASPDAPGRGGGPRGAAVQSCGFQGL